ncbi:MAG: hypothetical protein R2695_15640 [Acidimicrobiales bacterium]
METLRRARRRRRGASPWWWHDLAAHFDDAAVVAVAPGCTAPRTHGAERYEAAHSPLDSGCARRAVPPSGGVRADRRARRAAREALAAHRRVRRGFSHGEDVDLVWRLIARGGTVRYDPAVVMTHRPRATWRAWSDQRRRRGSAVALTARHGTDVAGPAVPCRVW